MCYTGNIDQESEFFFNSDLKKGAQDSQIVSKFAYLLRGGGHLANLREFFSSFAGGGWVAFCL